MASTSKVAKGGSVQAKITDGGKVIHYSAPAPAADRPAVGVPTNSPHPGSHEYHGSGKPHPGNPTPKAGGLEPYVSVPITSEQPQETQT